MTTTKLKAKRALKRKLTGTIKIPIQTVTVPPDVVKLFQAVMRRLDAMEQRLCYQPAAGPEAVSMEERSDAAQPKTISLLDRIRRLESRADSQEKLIINLDSVKEERRDVEEFRKAASEHWQAMRHVLDGLVNRLCRVENFLGVNDPERSEG